MAKESALELAVLQNCNDEERYNAWTNFKRTHILKMNRQDYGCGLNSLAYLGVLQPEEVEQLMDIVDPQIGTSFETIMNYVFHANGGVGNYTQHIIDIRTLGGIRELLSSLDGQLKPNSCTLIKLNFVGSRTGRGHTIVFSKDRAGQLWMVDPQQGKRIHLNAASEIQLISYFKHYAEANLLLVRHDQPSIHRGADFAKMFRDIRDLPLQLTGTLRNFPILQWSMGTKSIDKWSCLQPDVKKAEARDCIYNAMQFLDIFPRKRAEEMARFIQTTNISNAMALTANDNVFNFLKSIVHGRDVYSKHLSIDQIEEWFEETFRSLKSNHATLIAGTGQVGRPGHMFIIARTNTEELVIIDPQQETFYYGKSNIFIYLMQSFSEILVFTIGGKPKREEFATRIASVARVERGQLETQSRKRLKPEPVFTMGRVTKMNKSRRRATTVKIRRGSKTRSPSSSAASASSAVVSSVPAASDAPSTPL